MRLVNRETFLTLPPGTLFATLIEPWIFENPSIKGDTIADHDDFWLVDFVWPTNGPHDLDKMADGATAQMNTIVQREGPTPGTTRYLVFDPEDINLLMGVLGRSVTTLATAEDRRDLSHWRYRVGAIEREIGWNREVVERLNGLVHDFELSLLHDLKNTNPGLANEQIAEFWEEKRAESPNLAHLKSDRADVTEAITFNAFLLEEARWRVETLMVELLGERYGT